MRKLIAKFKDNHSIKIAKLTAIMLLPFAMFATARADEDAADWMKKQSSNFSTYINFGFSVLIVAGVFALISGLWMFKKIGRGDYGEEGGQYANAKKRAMVTLFAGVAMTSFGTVIKIILATAGSDDGKKNIESGEWGGNL